MFEKLVAGFKAWWAADARRRKEAKIKRLCQMFRDANCTEQECYCAGWCRKTDENVIYCNEMGLRRAGRIKGY
jgi:hypothetical protein